MILFAKILNLSQTAKYRQEKSVPPENIPCINFLLHIIQTSVIPVRDNRLALCLERRQVIHHAAAEERAAILQRRLVDDHLRSFGLDALHHALNARLAKIIGV